MVYTAMMTWYVLKPPALFWSSPGVIFRNPFLLFKRLLGIHYGPANFFSDDYNFIITPLYAVQEN